MQRLLRDEEHALVDLGLSARRQALIHRHCPPSIGNLFATPREGSDGSLEWWTELSGQSRPRDACSDVEQAQLDERLAQRLTALGNLIDELERRGDPAAAELRTLPTRPSNDTLYMVGVDPVMIRWTSTNTPKASVEPPAATAMLPPTASSVPQRRWPGLIPVMLLLSLALLGLWLGLKYREHIPLPWPGGNDEIVPTACRDKNTLPSQGKEISLLPDTPPEFVTILDTSGSMNLHISATAEDEEWYFGMPGRVRASLSSNARIQRIQASPSRLTVAKDAFADLVRAIDPAVDIGLVTYQGCETPVVQGRFSAEQRTALIKGVQELEADDGTPLAASLQQAAKMVDGRERDAVILAFVDGADGCGRNHCTVARDIAREKPRLRINVVDISNSGLSDCIANETGGRVFGSQDADAIRDMLKDAGREALSEAYCP